MQEKQRALHVNLGLHDIQTDRYRLLHEEREGLSTQTRSRTEDISESREQRTFSPLTLVAEVARYLNRSCIEIEEILTSTVDGMDTIVTRVNEFNELLYDCVIPQLFQEIYEITEYKRPEEQVIDLVKVPERGYYEVTANPTLLVREQERTEHAEKSFHLDAYSFDSLPEQNLFNYLLGDSRVKKVYFTGMLTHNQSDFFVQYIDPESHTIRSYYPDFLLQKTDDKYVIVEVKADNQLDAPVVVAKQTFAEKTAAASNMTYCIIKGSDANKGHYEMIWHPELREQYLKEATQNNLSVLEERG